jgi:GNAT superfamily N-acetyltransferase
MSRFEVVLADTKKLRRQVYRFRYRVYVGLMGRRQIYADHSSGTVIEPMDENGWNYLALVDGKLIGTIRSNTFDDPTTSYYRKILHNGRFEGVAVEKTQLTTKLMILPEYHGTSFGPRLIHAYSCEGYRRGIEVDFIDCNKHLIPMFERMGYFSYAGWVFHKEYGTVRPMFFAVDTIDYLRSLRSFLAEPASRHITNGRYGGYELVRRYAEPRMTEFVRGIAASHFPVAPAADTRAA